MAKSARRCTIAFASFSKSKSNRNPLCHNQAYMGHETAVAMEHNPKTYLGIALANLRCRMVKAQIECLDRLVYCFSTLISLSSQNYVVDAL
jgi:hypothetical protein